MPRADGGRPEGRSCPHAAATDPPHDDPAESGAGAADGAGRGAGSGAAGGCAECRARGRPWVRLRVCLTCGHVGCCDSSPGAHATAHHEATGHPVARSAEPGEAWGWCYVCELFLDPAPPPATARSGTPGR
ncbi:UBP-type zinc finger domain-containing protein [Streptomyces sp. NPDC091281]|uniref:UBP-type zinc finger domain-containing protein n=1 Tax=Streptomyces sp. NPDC091281 TaxID=3365985 RepID=UPI003808B233